MPASVRAYKIGNVLARRFGRPCSGLDGLIAADHWPDALGVIGEFLYELEPLQEREAEEEDVRVVKSVYARQIYGKALSPFMLPLIDEAWKRWREYRDPTPFIPRIRAAYVLARGDERDQAYALGILRDMKPIDLGFYLDRKERRE